MSYPLSPVTVPSIADVSASATSAAVTVIAQASGPAGVQGPAGPQGAAGSNGSDGTQGPAGARGPAGEVELVTCKTVGRKKRCSTRLLSSPGKFTESTALARLSRAGQVYATGSLRAGTLVLHSATPLRAGRYELELSTGSGHHKHTTTETITID